MESLWNLFRMINYPFAQNLEWIHASVCKLFHLLQIIVLCSILQHISDLYCILQQPDCFFENESLWNLFRMTNYPCVPSLEVIHKLVTEIYHLLQIISEFSQYFAAFCSNLIFFFKQNLSESIKNNQPPLCIKFGSNECICFQIIPFAACNVILQYFCSILQHFAETWYFLDNKTHLNQLRTTNYPCVPSLEVIHT